jgi:predicted nucleotidyltransferase
VTTAYAALLARAQADPGVAGLILTGSRARNLATAYSDADVFVVLREPDQAWQTRRTPELDTIVLTLADLADVSDRWQRYAYRGAVVLLDRLDGGVADLVTAQGTLSPAEADAWAREYLDGYVNFAYRAAKSRREGRIELALLDENEAVPWLLWTVFALHGRVRPYNKYLRWELETYPLPAPWTAQHLIPALAQRPLSLFADVEALARARGHGDVLDEWDDLELLRSR